MYKENPKTKGSGIICAIPQKGTCPNKCEDCFFQSGRSYLEPLEKNLPNMPMIRDTDYRVVRINDGNDSNVDREMVTESTWGYEMKFYNTAIPKDLEKFDAPVVLTINPKDEEINYAQIPDNLMFVRYRTNMWNLDRLPYVVDYYSRRQVPIVLTFMAYFNLNSIPKIYESCYIYRQRTMNSYYAITTEAWETAMFPYRYNKWIYSCGKIEGERGTNKCRYCGNCLREYFATMERMRE